MTGLVVGSNILKQLTVCFVSVPKPKVESYRSVKNKGVEVLTFASLHLT